MEKIKRLSLGFMLIAVLCIATACGRNDSTNKNTTAAPSTSSSAAATSGSTKESSTQSPGNTSSSAGTNQDGESGGVLRDMVDDVEKGVDDLADDITGTNGAAEGSGSGTSTER